MSSLSALVKELRGKTGAGILDCQKALQDTGSDIEKAIDLLRQKGLAAAQKKSRARNKGRAHLFVYSCRLKNWCPSRSELRNRFRRQERRVSVLCQRNRTANCGISTGLCQTRRYSCGPNRTGKKYLFGPSERIWQTRSLMGENCHRQIRKILSRAMPVGARPRFKRWFPKKLPN